MKDLNYADLGIKMFRKTQRHPITDIETQIFEIDCPENLLAIELEKVDVLLSDEEKLEMKVQPEEIEKTEQFSDKEKVIQDNGTSTEVQLASENLETKDTSINQENNEEK